MSDQDSSDFYDRILKGEMAQQAAVFSRLVERFGPGVLEEVQQVIIEQARQRLAQADLPDRDLDAVLELLWNQAGDQLEFEMLEHSPRRIRMKVTGCVYANEMRRMGAAEVGYAFYCAYDFGFCQGLNPHLHFSRTKTLMLGDDHCDHTYELEESLPE